MRLHVNFLYIYVSFNYCSFYCKYLKFEVAISRKHKEKKSWFLKSVIFRPEGTIIVLSCIHKYLYYFGKCIFYLAWCFDATQFTLSIILHFTRGSLVKFDKTRKHITDVTQTTTNDTHSHQH